MFYTPRGLKIRIPIQEAFTYLGRIYPKRTPEQVLGTAEALDHMASVLPLVGLIGLKLDFAVWATIAVAFSGVILGKLILWFGATNFLPGIVSTSYAWSRTPWLLRVPLVLGLAYWLQGKRGVLIWLATIAACYIGETTLEFIAHSRRYERHGTNFSDSELAFIQAWRHHALGLGVAWDREVTDGEIETGVWHEPLEHYMAQFPGRVPTR